MTGVQRPALQAVAAAAGDPRPEAGGRLRIAQLVAAFPVLSETFIVSQITGLIDAGHEVDIYAAQSGSSSHVHEDVVRYRLLERTRYLNPPAGYVARIVKVPALVAGAKAWRRPRVLLSALNAKRHGRFAMSLGLLYGSAAFLRHQPPYDVIHCQFGGIARLALALQDTGVAREKLVVSFRGADLTKQGSCEHYEEVFERARLMLPVCEAFRHRLMAKGCAPDKIRVHRSGIQVDRFTRTDRHRAPDEPTRILSIGRLVEKKGIAYAIEAVARLKAAGRRVRYSIVGDGVLREDLEALSERLGVRGEVQFLGPRSHQEVTRLLAEAHVLAAPSVTAADGEQEGIPNVLKEGMATGLPVVSTRHSGIPELVEDGRSGFLAPERDAEALADRLARVIDHPDRWSGMGRAGRERVEKEYDSDLLNRELIALYREAAGLTELPT